MRIVETSPSCVSSRSIGISTRTVAVSRLFDYLELTKPRIAVLALISVAVGYSLAASSSWQIVPLLHALFGVGLVAASSSALNQLLERSVDSRMIRTANRPLPAGRLLPGSVLCFGLTTGIAGCLYLAIFVNLATSLAALLTLLLYVVVYTPLKRVTSLCTAVGAIPGALPPVLGWLAATGEINIGAFILFAILYLWQFPHFVAIAWVYRKEYDQAGLRMLPSKGESRLAAGAIAVTYALVLLPTSLLPGQFSLAGDAYTLTAIILGVGYLICAIRFLLSGSLESARGVIWASLMYLPLLFLSLLWDHFQLLT
ncbi:MAG: protoheme IX farnesyltransferase [Planctomycetes bacterium]|nr:protoheme IX farnesyltransferase [Planctomycetota bacterium]